MEKVVNNIIAIILITVLLLCMSTVARADSDTYQTKSKVLREYREKKDKKKKKKRIKAKWIINVTQPPCYYHNTYRYYRYRRCYRGCGRR